MASAIAAVGAAGRSLTFSKAHLWLELVLLVHNATSVPSADPLFVTSAEKPVLSAALILKEASPLLIMFQRTWLLLVLSFWFMLTEFAGVALARCKYFPVPMF